jgi:transposase
MKGAFMYNDIIKLLNLEQFNIKIKKLETIKKDNILYCYITLESTASHCTLCGGTEYTIKDYRNKKIAHSISTNNQCFIIYMARRYKCKYCNSIFYEHNPFSLKNDKESSYTIYKV